MVLYGTYAGSPAGTVHLEGMLGGEPVRIPVEVDFSNAENASGLASMWARKQIDEWLGSRRLREESDKIRGLVTALAIERRIMTEYTAFVAVDESGPAEATPETGEADQGREIAGKAKLAGSAGGLGLVGTGRGGGGTGEGTIGLGNTGLIGKGGGGGSGSGYGSGYGRGSGAGFGGRGRRVPRVRQAKAKVMGNLDRDIIRRIVRAHINQVRHCYNQGLAKDPNLKGRLSVKFTIAATGLVSTSEVEASMGNNEVDQCVAEAVKRWKFPKPSGGGTVLVTYPFVLEPG